MLEQINYAVGVAPLVVVPRHQLDEGRRERDARVSVEDRGVLVADEVRGDDCVLGVVEDALHRALGGGLEGGVDLLDRDLALDDGREVGQRAVRSRNAEREAVQLAGQLGEDEADRLGGAGRRRDDRERGGAGAAEVAVRSVRDPLVGRVGVDGRHHALLDAERVVEDLDHRGEAVGGGGRGDLYVHVRVKAHKKFTREGDIILSEEHIDMVQAALGTKIDVETVDGVATMKVPAGTQSGTDFKLSGHGVPHVRQESRGPHIVTIIVDTPTKLSKKQKELLEQFGGAKKRGLF